MTKNKLAGLPLEIKLNSRIDTDTHSEAKSAECTRGGPVRVHAPKVTYKLQLIQAESQKLTKSQFTLQISYENITKENTHTMDYSATHKDKDWCWREEPHSQQTHAHAIADIRCRQIAQFSDLHIRLHDTLHRIESDEGLPHIIKHFRDQLIKHSGERGSVE